MSKAALGCPFCIYKLYTIVYTSLTRTLHSPYTVLSRALHSPYTVLTRALHGPYTALTQSCTNYTKYCHSLYLRDASVVYCIYCLYTIVYTSLTWSLHSSYTVLTQSLHGPYTVLTRALDSLTLPYTTVYINIVISCRSGEPLDVHFVYTGFTRLCIQALHGPYTVLTQALHSPYTVLTRSLHGPSTILTQSYTALHKSIIL